MKTPKIALAPVWLVLPALLALLYVWTAVELPVDFWHRANSGRMMWQTGTLAERDVFTHTIAGRPILNQNWLAELAMYGLVRAGGFPLVQFVAGICYATALAIITTLCWYRSGNVRVAAGLALVGLVLAASNLGVRSQAFSAVLLAVELFALWRWPDRRSTVAVVAVVELLWTNTHGAFPLGVVLPGVFFMATAWKTWRKGGFRAMSADRTTRCCLACVLVAIVMMFCCPHPEKTMDYVLGVASKSSERQIEEWLPTSLGNYAGVVFSASVVLVIAVVGLARRRLDPVGVLLLVAFAVLAYRAQRMVIWWALVMPAALAPQAAGLWNSWKKTPAKRDERSPLNFVILCLLIGLALMSTPWTRPYNPLLPPAKRLLYPVDEPRQVVGFLKRSGCRGRIFNTMEWGGYLSWHLQPEVKVFIDGRIDFFPDAVWNDYIRIAGAAPDWELTLARYNVEVVVWNPELSKKLPIALEQSPGWKNVYHDATATVFARRE